MTTLILVRHGETVDNANRIMQGQTQGQLNETGMRQAEEVADRLAGEHIDAVVSSDLKRSYDTACIIANRHRLNVSTTELLRERDWGGFTGRYIPDLKDEKWPDDIESLDHLLCRAKNFLDFVCSEYPDCRVVAVGHGIINKAVQAIYHKVAMNEVRPMANCEIRILEL